jgi:TatA/E family protein of Tat protein translocase
MGPLGVQEMVVIFLVALGLFGPKKLPELGKTIAKAVTEFRRAQSDLKATFEREMQAIERENESLKEVTRQTAVELASYSDIDLVGGPSGTYDQRASESTPDHPTVSASAVPGAESHAELEPHASSVAERMPESPVVQGNVEGTVPRGASVAEGGAAPSGVEKIEANPLPEFAHPTGGPSKHADEELPSIV